MKKSFIFFIFGLVFLAGAHTARAYYNDYPTYNAYTPPNYYTSYIPPRYSNGYSSYPSMNYYTAYNEPYNSYNSYGGNFYTSYNEPTNYYTPYIPPTNYYTAYNYNGRCNRNPNTRNDRVITGSCWR